MIHTYYMNVTQFEDETFFREKVSLLSPYRQQKIAQQKQEADKRRSLGAGLALDYALRCYGQGLKERDMEYVSGEWGKPAFRDYPQIHFSLSHSGEYAMCSIGDRPVGNDIERVRQGRLKVAERFFTAPERAFLYGEQSGDGEPVFLDRCMRLSRNACAAGGKECDSGKSTACDVQECEDEEITQRMFRIWTMKESFLKVTGRGMTLPLNAFSVIVEDERGIVRVEHSFDDAVYPMKEYGEIPGYRAAVCCQGDGEMAENMESAAL